MKRTRLVGCSLAVVALALGVFYVMNRWVDIPFASRDLDRQWARAEKNGYPLKASDLRPTPPVRQEENAAPLLLHAVSLVDHDLRDRLNEAGPRARAGKTPAKEMDRLLARAKPALDLVGQAVQKPRYWVNRDYDLGPELLFPEFSVYRALARGLAARAEKKAKKGDLQGAIRDLRQIRQLAALVSTEPTLIGELVGVAIDDIATLGAEKVAESVCNNPTALASLRKASVDVAPLRIDLRVGLRLEIYMTLAIARNARRYGGILRALHDIGPGKPDPTLPIQREGPPEGWTARSFAARSMAAWNDVLESPEWKSGDPLAIGRISRRIEDKYWGHNPEGLSYAAGPMQFPVFSGAGKQMIRPSASRATLVALLTVLEYRAGHGAYPRTLAEAGADAPDPFLTGGRLRYSTNGSSAKVWSVGPDGKDDGGESKNRRDIVAYYPAR